MGNSAYAVGVVVDPEFGERLGALAARMPVWVVDTPTNRAAAEALWRRNADANDHAVPGSVTTFRVDAAASPAQWCAGILNVVDLHHGEHSHDPPYSAVEVVGAELTAELRAALAELGLTHVEPRPGGFRASSRPAA